MNFVSSPPSNFLYTLNQLKRTKEGYTVAIQNTHNKKQLINLHVFIFRINLS